MRAVGLRTVSGSSSRLPTQFGPGCIDHKGQAIVGVHRKVGKKKDHRYVVLIDDYFLYETSDELFDFRYVAFFDVLPERHQQQAQISFGDRF